MRFLSVTPQDLAESAPEFVHAWRSYYRNHWLFRYDALSAFEPLSADVVCHVAISDSSTPVAALHLERPTPSTFGNAPLWISNVWTAERWRRRGVATALVLATVQQATESFPKGTTIGLCADRASGPENLYWRIGFSHTTWSSHVMFFGLEPSVVIPIERGCAVPVRPWDVGGLARSLGTSSWETTGATTSETHYDDPEERFAQVLHQGDLGTLEHLTSQRADRIVVWRHRWRDSVIVRVVFVPRNVPNHEVRRIVVSHWRTIQVDG